MTMGKKTDKWSFFIPGLAIFVTLVFAVLSAYGKELGVIRTKEGYEFQVYIDRNPPIIGDNNIKIAIKDASGAPVRDAKVQVNYYMPPMPRMAPMNYLADAEMRKEKYEATMNFIMAGPWIIRVIVNHEGRRAVAKFNVDAQ
jgi:hypothetical protein